MLYVSLYKNETFSQPRKFSDTENILVIFPMLKSFFTKLFSLPKKKILRKKISRENSNVEKFLYIKIKLFFQLDKFFSGKKYLVKTPMLKSFFT